MVVAVTAMVIGAGISAYGSYKAGKAEQALANQQADLLEISAGRILELNEQNTEQTELDESLTRSANVAGSAARGVGVNLNSLTSISNAAIREIEINTEEAEFNARKMRLEAKQVRSSGKASSRAGKIAAAGSLVTAGGKAYGAYKGGNSSGGAGPNSGGSGPTDKDHR